MEALLRNPVTKVRQTIRRRTLRPVTRRVIADRLTYLHWTKLESLERACHDVRRVCGDVIECGLALGGSGIALAHLLPEKCFHGYDVFEQIPAPGERDDAKSHDRYATIAAGESAGLDGDIYYGYLPDLYERVQASFAAYGVPTGERVQLHRGLFEDALRVERPVALAHIDCDWYEPVRLCLERIAPHVSVGGQIILDDYFAFGGCRDATDEFLAARPEFGVHRDARHRVLIRR